MHERNHHIAAMKIKDMGKEERPREKMIEKGPEALSKGELIAILLRTGTREDSALDLAWRLLDACDNSLARLVNMKSESLMAIKGIGRDKACTLEAAFELGRRFFAEGFSGRKRTIDNPGLVYEEMTPYLKGLAHEECWLVYLNKANYIIGKERISSGGLDSTVLDTRMIGARVLEKKATGVILVHNHPSGNPVPGTADMQETENLKKALETLGIVLTDHIVFSDDCYFSFAEECICQA